MNDILTIELLAKLDEAIEELDFQKPMLKRATTQRRLTYIDDALALIIRDLEDARKLIQAQIKNCKDKE